MEAVAREAEQKLERLHADIAQAKKRLTALDRSAACLTFTALCLEPCLHGVSVSAVTDCQFYAKSSGVAHSSACYSAWLLCCFLQAASCECLVALCRAPAPHAWLNLHSIAGMSWLLMAA